MQWMITWHGCYGNVNVHAYGVVWVCMNDDGSNDEWMMGMKLSSNGNGWI